MAEEPRDITDVTIESWGRVLRWVGLVICVLALVGGLLSDQGGMFWAGVLGILAFVFNRVMFRRASQRRGAAPVHSGAERSQHE